MQNTIFNQFYDCRVKDMFMSDIFPDSLVYLILFDSLAKQGVQCAKILSKIHFN